MRPTLLRLLLPAVFLSLFVLRGGAQLADSVLEKRLRAPFAKGYELPPHQLQLVREAAADFVGVPRPDPPLRGNCLVRLCKKTKATLGFGPKRFEGVRYNSLDHEGMAKALVAEIHLGGYFKFKAPEAESVPQYVLNGMRRHYNAAFLGIPPTPPHRIDTSSLETSPATTPKAMQYPWDHQRSLVWRSLSSPTSLVRSRSETEIDFDPPHVSPAHNFALFRNVVLPGSSSSSRQGTGIGTSSPPATSSRN